MTTAHCARNSSTNDSLSLLIIYCTPHVHSSCTLTVCVHTRIQGYLFANDIKMCTGICLGDVQIIQNGLYTTATSPIKNNY